MGVRDWMKDARADIFLDLKFVSNDTDKAAGRYDVKGLDWLPAKVGGCDVVKTVNKATTSGVTTTTSAYTSVHAILIKSRNDNTAATEIHWWMKKGAAAAGNIVIVQASPDTITRAATNWATTPEFAAAMDWVHLSSAAEDAGNQNTYHPIQALAAGGGTNGQLVLAQDATITANADDDTVICTILHQNKAILKPGEVHLIMGNDNFWVAKNLVCTARASTQYLDVAIVKT